MRRKPTREEAWKLLVEYNPSLSLQRHALSVEAVMRHMARKHGEDEDQWGLVGMAHDLDYERFPEQHCVKVREILDQHGWPEDYVRAVVSHGWGICSDEEPQSLMEKTLFAIDELTGLVTAAALVPLLCALAGMMHAQVCRIKQAITLRIDVKIAKSVGFTDTLDFRVNHIEDFAFPPDTLPAARS